MGDVNSEMLLMEFRRLQSLVESALEDRSPDSAETAARERGLIGYQGLRACLAIDGKKPCLRKVKSLVSKHKGVIRPVALGHNMVGFRPARVEALIAHLSGENQERGGIL